ncbi:hypothetical protein FBQ83_15295 [Chloroflexi bacterium CFX5]|nr:hypothetical protein [Chloroflexi bacterium CFX5]
MSFENLPSPDCKRKLRIQPGARIAVTEDGGSIILTPITDVRPRLWKGRGLMKGFWRRRRGRMPALK